MRPTLRIKVFLTLLLATGAVVAGMYAFMQWSFERGFIGFVEARQQAQVLRLADRLADEYTRAGDWERLRGDRQRWVRILSGNRRGLARRLAHIEGLQMGADSREWPPPHMTPNRRGAGGARVPLRFRLMLFDADKQVIFGRADKLQQLTLTPIRAKGISVGYLGVVPGPALNELGDVRFIRQQTKAFVIIAVIMVLLAGLLSLPLADTLVRPLKKITGASRALAQGRYDTRVQLSRRDELGQLATDFNDLASALEKTEQNRRQWVADISHELRTPLSVLRGEIEALQDGVRPLDGAAVDSLHGDVMRLNRLVEDLYDLSMSDMGTLSYRKADTDPAAILRDNMESLQGEFQARDILVRLNEDKAGSGVVHADADRLSQLFCNLLNNTLRYTDSEGDDGGRLEITLHQNVNQWVVDFDDSAPGVPEQDLPRLFERFHRVEGSRSRSSGGAGLGLAICRNIVEAHDGSIHAAPSSLGGLRIRVTLPLKP